MLRLLKLFIFYCVVIHRRTISDIVWIFLLIVFLLICLVYYFNYAVAPLGITKIEELIPSQNIRLTPEKGINPLFHPRPYSFEWMYKFNMFSVVKPNSIFHHFYFNENGWIRFLKKSSLDIMNLFSKSPQKNYMSSTIYNFRKNEINLFQQYLVRENKFNKNLKLQLAYRDNLIHEANFSYDLSTYFIQVDLNPQSTLARRKLIIIDELDLISNQIIESQYGLDKIELKLADCNKNKLYELHVRRFNLLKNLEQYKISYKRNLNMLEVVNKKQGLIIDFEDIYPIKKY